MTPGRRRLLVAAVLIAAVVVAFLVFRGGEEGGREVTHAELVSETNRVCTELERKNRALEPPFRPYSSLNEAYFSSFLDNVEEAWEQLGELEPPPADRETFAAVVDGYGQIRLNLQEVQGAAATDQDPEVIALMGQIDDLTRSLAARERALGVCAGDTSARIAVAQLLKRTVPNPLEETGELGG